MMRGFLQRRREPPLRPLERKLFDALVAHLSSDAREVLHGQLRLVNRVQRHTDGKEVNLYQIRRRKVSLEGMPVFPFAVEEAKLASVRYRVTGETRTRRVDFWLVNGHLFQMQFRESPRGVDAEKVEIRDVKLLVDPMVPAQPEERRSLDLTALTGWLAEWSHQRQVGDLREPPPPEQRAERLGRIEAALPSDYVELLSQTDGLQVERCRVYGLSDVREVVLPDATYYVLAEMEDRGVLGVRQGQPDGELFFFAYEGDGVAVGKSLRAAVEMLLDAQDD
jgi:hypothetical protein